MKVVILAGGFGTRLSEETHARPKPMIDVGGKPILWHIMKMYSHHGFSEFIICLGYKGHMIKEYFANYFLHQSDVTIDLKENSMAIHGSQAEDWRITLVDTGLNTMTGGRIKRIQKYVGNETFMVAYGDGVADLDLRSVLDFHRQKGKLATLTAVQPVGRFGALALDEASTVLSFKEKPKGGEGKWVNTGFFVLEPQVFDYITEGDKTILERTPLECLSMEGQLAAYKHPGFWQPMDTLKDKQELDALFHSGNAPWMMWVKDVQQ